MKKILTILLSLSMISSAMASPDFKLAGTWRQQNAQDPNVINIAAITSVNAELFMNFHDQQNQSYSCKFKWEGMVQWYDPETYDFGIVLNHPSLAHPGPGTTVEYCQKNLPDFTQIFGKLVNDNLEIDKDIYKKD